MGNSQFGDLEDYPHLDNNIAIVDHLGSGMSCQMKLGIYKESGEKVAVKIINKNIPKEFEDIILKEVEIKEFDHKNIIKMLDHGCGSFVQNDVPRKIKYMITEYAENGELFDYIAIRKEHMSE